MEYFLLTMGMFIGGFWLYAKAKRTWTALATRDATPDSFVVVDVETTGLDPHSDRIIEVGAIRMDRAGLSHRETESFSALVKIDQPIPEEAVKIHGITDQMLKDSGIQIDQALSKIKEMVGDLPVVAYNATFDQSFINAEAKRCGLRPIIKTPTCALKLARSAWRGRSSYKLGVVARSVGHSDRGLHRSNADCRAACAVYLRAAPIVLDRYRGA